MRIDVLTLFPAMFRGVLDASILQRAADAHAVAYHLHDIRRHTDDKHGKVDQPPFGGGPGMVMQCQPVWDCLEHVEAQEPDLAPTRVLLTPQGRPLDQPTVERLARRPRLLLLAGHYEGLDQRVVEAIDQRPGGLEEISLGDYVLSGGELPAMVLIDAVVRLLPGVLGHEQSAEHDSFAPGCDHLLDHPHYTRPRVWRDRGVPEVLLSGDHARIDAWRARQRRERTRRRRPELLAEPGSHTGTRSHAGPDEKTGKGARLPCAVLRDETKADATAIREVHLATFPNPAEADLLERLRRDGDASISILAEVETPVGVEVVGHAVLSPARLAEQPGLAGYLGLAPIAVRPEWQRRGLGSALLRRLIDRARRAAVRGVFVLGDPAFYSRFGFEPAYAHGFSTRFVAADAPDGPGTPDAPGRDAFRLLPLRPVDPHHAGPVRYADAIEALADQDGGDGDEAGDA